jgi:hypothetical protein
MIRDRRQLNERLKALGRYLEFGGDRSARWSDGQVGVSIDRVGEPGGPHDLLITVFAGFPPRPAVRGQPWTIRTIQDQQIVRVGQTDRRGQFRLRELEPGAYRLEFEGLAAEPAVAPIAAEFAAIQPLSAATSPEPADQPFHSEDGIVRAVLRLTSEDDLALEATIAAAAADRLARYRIWDADHQLISRGYIGLIPAEHPQGTCFGQVILAPSVRERWDVSCYIEVVPLPHQVLTSDDRADLVRSIDGTDLPACRAALEEALARLPETEKE